MLNSSRRVSGDRAQLNKYIVLEKSGIFKGVDECDA